MARAIAALLSLSALLLSGCLAAQVNDDRRALVAHSALNAIPRHQPVIVPSETLLLDVRLDRQIARNGCGAHAASSLIEYWRRSAPRGSDLPPVSGGGIYEATPPASATGYTLAEIARLLHQNGLVALVVTSTPDAVEQELRSGRPVIVRVAISASHLRTTHVFPTATPLLAALETRAFEIAARIVGVTEADHYWIVMGFDDHRMIVMDPALGLRSVARPAFDEAFQRGGSLAVVSGGWAAPA